MPNIVFSLIAKSIYRDSYMLVWSIVLPLGLFIGLGGYFDNDSYRESLLVGSILISVIMGAINTSGFWMMTQRKRGVFKLIKLSSLSTTKFVVCSVLARLLVFMIITLLLMLLGKLIFGLTIGVRGALSLIFITIVGGICFNAIGYIIASRVSNEGMMNMTSTLCSMPMIFFSSTFYSLDNAPQWIQFISKLNPFQYAAELGKGALMGNGTANVLNALVLVVFALICAIAAVKTFRYE